MDTLNALKKHLRPGQVYRRADLEAWSNAVDRHLKQLQVDGTLVKLSGGLYHYPEKTAFGDAPPEDAVLVRAFLKDSRFLLTSPNAYNALGLGTTQLYNETVVYNHKRHGRFRLGGRAFDFRVKPHVPQTMTQEFLMVDLAGHPEQLAENIHAVLERLKAKARAMDGGALAKAVRRYGGTRARKFFAEALGDATLRYGS